MLNYKRRKRQADENSNIIINRFAEEIQMGKEMYPGEYSIKSDSELMELIDKIQVEVRAKANTIQPDWSIPMILEAIGRLYYGKHREQQKYGTIFKRALVYLWNVNTNAFSDKKNLEGILEVLRLCYVLETLYGFRRFFLVAEEFSFEVKNGYCYWNEEFTPMIYEFAELNHGRGKRMRIAEVNSKLMNEKPGEFYEALLSVLAGIDPKDVAVFQGTFYQEIPGISNAECKKFWQSIFLRYALYTATALKESAEMGDDAELEPSVTLFPEFGVMLPEGLFTQEIVQYVFWNRAWVESQSDERYGNLIAERPILRITPMGDFATCSVLIGDSINSFIEGQILNYTSRSPKINLPRSVFKNAISEPFEDKVINGLRQLGFLTGHVSEEGIWGTQEGAINLNWPSAEKLYGEVDALAYNPVLNFAILVECKVLNDVRDYKSYKNIIAKLVDDSEGFQAKLLSKSEWVNKALSQYYNTEVWAVCVLLTDISIPIVDFANEDIILTYYNRFISCIAEIIETYGIYGSHEK